MSSKNGTVINALSVDVEDYFHGLAFSYLEKKAWDKMEERVTQNTRRLLSIFAQSRVKATFFVLGWVAERYPFLVREIDEQGHEVATHGYGHRSIFHQTRAEFYEDLQLSKKILSDITGKRVIGYRAPNFSIVRETMWALDVLQELGFLYDSSIFPIYHDYYGIPGANRYPYEIREGLWEFPLSTIPVDSVLTLPLAGGGYFRFYPYWLTKWGITHLNRRGQAAIIYLHPHEIDSHEPRVQHGLRRIRRRIRLGDTEKKLVRVLRDFKFGPMAGLEPEFLKATGG